MRSLFTLLVLVLSLTTKAQPWENPLVIARSIDGVNFTNNAIFQDSSGVPSVIRWKGDTLICAFQWFRQPNPSPSWDRVAVKFSYDNGLNWTSPSPIVVNGIPSQYQRPFDPTLVRLSNSDSIRIYYSSSDGIPAGGLDSTINTYSAVSTDGINFTFENNARVDVNNNRVIDPAVIRFKNAWHYISPIGAPQDGAYHYVSPDGLNFSATPNVNSDNQHNWTGNYMIEDTSELRFYGSSSAYIWYNSTANGGVWNGYVNTNVQGGDPSVLKLSDSSYIMIYVGAPNFTSIRTTQIEEGQSFILFPNPSKELVFVQAQDGNLVENADYRVFNTLGQLMQSGSTSATGSFSVLSLPSGFYFIELPNSNQVLKLQKE